MSQIHCLGDGKFRGITNTEGLKKLGYISGKKVSDYLFKYLCDSTYEDGGLEKHKNTMKLISEKLDKVQTGEGKSTSYYYLESEVIAMIGSVRDNNMDGVRTTQEASKLTENGYISGSIVGISLFKLLKLHNVPNLNSVYNKEFKNLRKSVKTKSVGERKGRRYYYLKEEVNAYLDKLNRECILKNKK